MSKKDLGRPMASSLSVWNGPPESPIEDEAEPKLDWPVDEIVSVRMYWFMVESLLEQFDSAVVLQPEGNLSGVWG